MYAKKLAIFTVAFLVASSIVAFGTSAVVAQGENRAQAGEMAPPFSVETLENRTVALGNYQGKVLVLDFYAAWCHVCKDTTPELRQVRENFSPENLAMLSIESDSAVPSENDRAFRSEYGGDWPFAQAPDVAGRYGVGGYPTIFIVDPGGYIAFRSDGAVPPDVLNSIVADLLGPETPENRPENRVGVTNMIIDVRVRPENAGGIVATSLEIEENGEPLFTYQAKANPGYVFENWSGETLSENQAGGKTLRIVPAPGTKVTANFAPLEGTPGETEGGTGIFPSGIVMVYFALGAVVAGSLGILGGYLVWGRSGSEPEG